MDKFAYAASNFQLRLAGILMDTWIFFLFVAIAGESLFLFPLYRRRASHTPFHSIPVDPNSKIVDVLPRCSRCIDWTSGSQRDSVRVLSLDVSIRITYAQQARAAR